MTEFEKNNFCNREAADALREAGFDEDCIAIFNGDVFIQSVKGRNFDYAHTNGLVISAPLLTQARKFLRERRGIDVLVGYDFRDSIFHYVGSNLHADIHGKDLFYGNTAFEYEAYCNGIIKACEILKAKSQIQSQTGL